MQHKEFSRRFQRFLARTAIQFCAFIVKIIPASWAYGFARMVGNFGYIVASKQRNIAIESLTIAFGKEKSNDEIAQIARDCFQTMAKIAIEFMLFTERPVFVDRFVNVKGLENLDRALAKKSGVIALSAHFGNFPLMCTKLSFAGYKISTILRYMRDQWVNNYFYTRRTALGVGSIYTQPRKQCVEGCLDVLNKKEILFMQLDQNFGTGGVWVDFFGKKAGTAKGPIVFALRTKAPIVPMFIYRTENERQQIVIEPEVQLLEGKDTDETIQLNLQHLTKIIESYIRKYPKEWGWIHRRWKARPEEERLNKAQSQESAADQDLA